MHWSLLIALSHVDVLLQVWYDSYRLVPLCWSAMGLVA